MTDEAMTDEAMTDEAMTDELWKKFQNDFNAMTDDEIDEEICEIKEHIIWFEAVSAWIKAGRPRNKT